MQFKIQLFLSFCLFLNLLHHIIQPITIRLSPLSILKRARSYAQLKDFVMCLLRDRQTGRQVLVALLSSQKTAFGTHYVHICQGPQAQEILDNLLTNWGVADVETIKNLFPLECLVGNYALFKKFESTFASLGSVSPLQSLRFRPSRWNLSSFLFYLKQAISPSKPQNLNLVAWCMDLNFNVSNMFIVMNWDEQPRLWRVVNYKCIRPPALKDSQFQLESNSRFVGVFSASTDDSAMHILMKNISLLSLLKAAKTNGLQALSSISYQINAFILSNQLKLATEYSDGEMHSMSSMFERLFNSSSGVPPHASDHQLLWRFMILIRESALLSTSWLLNLFYIISDLQDNEESLNFKTKVIDLFFLNKPSPYEVCQLLEVIFTCSSSLADLVQTRSRGLPKDFQLKLHNHCEEYLPTFFLDFESRLAMFLRKHRCTTSLDSGFKMDIDGNFVNQFWYVSREIFRNKHNLLGRLNASFLHNGVRSQLHNLESFLQHFLNLFLAESGWYHRLGTLGDGRPLIVPSLRLPSVIFQIIVEVLCRSIVLNFQVPFLLHRRFFKLVIDEDLKPMLLQSRFYSRLENPEDPILISSYNIHACTDPESIWDFIHVNSQDLELMFDMDDVQDEADKGIQSISRLTFENISKLVENFIFAFREGILIFTEDGLFTNHEIYHLLFNK